MSTPAPDFPAIRNNWTRVAMRRIRTYPDDKRRGLLDAIPRETQNAIAHGRPDEWLPAEHAIAVCDALLQQAGVDEAVEFWRTIVFDSYAGGLLEPLIVGLNEDTDLLELAPKAWELSACNCGRVGVVLGSSGLRLEAHDLPPGMRESQGIQAMFAGAVRAILAFSKLEAQIRFDAELPEGAIGFELQLGPAR
jgi:hypothetical protein